MDQVNRFYHFDGSPPSDSTIAIIAAVLLAALAMNIFLMVRERISRKTNLQFWPALAVVVIVATALLVNSWLPNYLPSHLAQAAAVVVGFAYFWRFSLWSKYSDWIRRSLLIIAFAAPLDNLLAMKIIRKVAFDSYVGLEIFRPVILLLIGAAIGTALKKKFPKWHPLLVVSAVLALASWLVSTVAALDPPYAFSVSFFELMVPFIAIYAYSANADDDHFLVHTLILFGLGFIIVAGSQSISVLMQSCCALTAEDFLADKMDVELIQIAGANGYGNPGNFIPLWVAMLPLAAGSLLFQNGFAKTKIALLFSLVYAGLLVYSRAGIFMAFVGLSAASLLMLRAHRFTLVAPAAIAVIIAVHLPAGAFAYYAAGFNSLVFSTDAPEGSARRERYTVKDVMAGRRDLSGSDRSQAIRTGVAIAKDHWLTGIGSGHYARVDTLYTAPHSMIVLRFAENGILGLASLLILFAIPPIELIRRRKNIDASMASSAIAAICFAAYVSAFGGSFSDHGLVVWGLAIALLISTVERSANTSRADVPERRQRAYGEKPVSNQKHISI